MEILGIDIGGSGIKGAIVDTKTGELLTERHRIPTPEDRKPEDVANTVKAIVDHFNWKGKVGCGLPTAIHHGKALYKSNLHKSWVGVQVDELFEKATGLDFTVVNDADAAAMAAMHFGVGKGEMGFVLMITVGTGIGAGAFYNGHLIPNFELGHIPYKKYTKIEDWAADSARKRDGLSMKAWAKRFDKYLKIVERILVPDLFIIGGGVSKKFDSFKDFLNVKTPVVAAAYQNNAGIVGAALGVVEEKYHQKKISEATA